MSAAQPIPINGYINGYTRGDKMTGEQVRYAKASETGLDGPDQVLAATVDTTTDADGRVRIQLDNEGVNYASPVSVPGLLKRTAEKYPDHIALVARPDVNGHRKTYTFREYAKQVRTVAKAFIKLGLQRYHSVCILGFNSPEWFVSDLAAIEAGGIAAGIYTTNSPEACKYCAESSRANIIVVEDEKQLEKIQQIRKDLPHLKAVIQYEGLPKVKDVLSWHELLEIGEKESDDKLDAVQRTIGANECCIFVYTSGTVGNPKAVMLSHDNVVHDARVIANTVKFEEATTVVVSYLPLSHIAAQVVDILTCLTLAGTVYFADKNALKGSLVETLLVARPTVFVGVPRVWEKIYEKMQSVARNNGRVKTWIANWAKAQAVYYHNNKINGVDYKHWGYVIAKWLVFDKVRAALGLDRCALPMTAAAPLSMEVKKYFLSLDIPVYEVYGMSECSGGHTMCLPSRYRPGSVGPVMQGFRTKLVDADSTGEGEVCMHGRHVLMGYLNEPEKTREVKDDEGWLYSGDLGRIEPDGFVYITGRKKELIITAGGENIPPVHIEQLVMAELSVLSNVMLIGDQRKYLTVLVTLKTNVNADSGMPLDTFAPETLAWAKSIGSTSTTVTDVLNTKDPLIFKEIEAAIKRANGKAVSNAQKVQKFRILPHDFSLPTGELGPTLKLKRSVVQHKYSEIIDEMYNEDN